MRFSSLLLLASTASATSLPVTERQSRKLEFLGVNEAGAEFGEGNLPGVWGIDYTFPSQSSIQTFLNNGFNVIRVNFRMERLTPGGLTAGFNDAYLANLTQTCNYITNAGAYCMLDPHNYGKFNGQIITSTADFGTWFGRLASQFRSNSRVIFDVNNEFNSEPSQLVADLNQAAINAIRAAGATSQYITPEGNHWSGAWTWTTTQGTDGKTNAEVMGALTDPSDKLIYQMHQYLDSDASGTSPNCVSSTIGRERLQAATQWLRQNGKKALIGEFAGGVNSQCQAAVQDMLAYMAQNSDVWTGALWWAAGPWWGNYLYSLEPNSGVAYNAYLPILKAAQ